VTVGTTTGPWGLLFGGVLVLAGGGVGPSAGHIYAGDTTRAIVMSSIRGALISTGVATGVFGVMRSTEHLSKINALTVTSLVCFGAAGALAIWDVVDAPFAAKRANRRRSLALYPLPLLGSHEGAATAGLAVAGTF